METTELIGLGKLVGGLSSLPVAVEAGVKVSGEAAGYALVWEWGRVGVSPGPKTLWSDNPDGEIRVLTLTAPHGWIRVNRIRYETLLKQKVGALNFASSPIEQWAKMLEGAVESAASESMEIMVETAPIDTGLLRGSLSVVKGGDPLLEDNDGALDLGFEL